MKGSLASFGRFAALLIVSALMLQVVFALHIAMWRVVDPASTSFQRSEIWRLMIAGDGFTWSRRWVDDAQISSNLKRAVIASEDAGFSDHSGVEWDAIEKAWERNQKAQSRIEKLGEQAQRRNPPKADQPAGRSPAVAKVIGGSTITQQLAKNLFLSGERNLARKAQEFIITLMIEGLLDKQRILEIYLNSVEWGEGVFGAEAAAQHYFRIPAAQLGPQPAARLAVMLPAPKRFEKRPDSPYVRSRAAAVAARMGGVELP